MLKGILERSVDCLLRRLHFPDLSKPFFGVGCMYSQEVFALKFGKPQDAEEFKKAFDEAKKAMKAFVAGKLGWDVPFPSSIYIFIDDPLCVHPCSGRGA